MERYKLKLPVFPVQKPSSLQRDHPSTSDLVRSASSTTVAVDSSEMPVDWWEQDLSRWPGPEEDNSLAPGTIMAYRHSPHHPIGVLLGVSGQTATIQMRDYNHGSRESLNQTSYMNDLVPYSAG